MPNLLKLYDRILVAALDLTSSHLMWQNNSSRLRNMPINFVIYMAKDDALYIFHDKLVWQPAFLTKKKTICVIVLSEITNLSQISIRNNVTHYCYPLAASVSIERSLQKVTWMGGWWINDSWSLMAFIRSKTRS